MSIVERIKTHSSRLTDSDQKIIAMRMENRAEAAFLSDPQLAQRAQVHEAAATRLAQKLGFKGFPDLRSQSQREVLEAQDAANRTRNLYPRLNTAPSLPTLSTLKWPRS